MRRSTLAAFGGGVSVPAWLHLRPEPRPEPHPGPHPDPQPDLP
jgi:hypothetical protein